MSKIHELYLLSHRGPVPKHVKLKTKPQEAKHLVRYKDEKDYEYYICDFCGDEIKIQKKRHEMSGGTVELSKILTHGREIKLALCNKCLKPVLKLFEDEYNKE